MMSSVLDFDSSSSFSYTASVIEARFFLSTADPHRDRAASTKNTASVSTLDTKAANQSRTTHGCSKICYQLVAGRDGHNPNNATTFSLPDSTTSQIQNPCSHSNAKKSPALCALTHHATNQTQADLTMQRYLSEKDEYTEFLVGHQHQRLLQTSSSEAQTE